MANTSTIDQINTDLTRPADSSEPEQWELEKDQWGNKLNKTTFSQIDDNFTLVNLTGGKSWRISKANRNTVGFFASINNLLDIEYKTGGFEQSRKATFPDLQADQANGTPSFGPKYFYGYGRTFFVNFYINF